MAIPQKVIDFLKENEDKTKEEAIKAMMVEFNYKKSTSIKCYSENYSGINGVENRVFDFLEKNPIALENNVINKYIKKIGVSKTAYLKYKSKYILENNIEPSKKIQIQEDSLYYKGRLRKKFFIDDSKLFL